ncbi:hypothetical protein ACFQ0O_30635 [Saccharopolyspora spinosporotrichia]
MSTAARPERDACPGALRVHDAADGGLARVRVPGGALTPRQFAVLGAASAGLGDGGLELTSRANVQVRGLAAGRQRELADRLSGAGLLPSATHERVRNILGSPYDDDRALLDTQAVARALDEALCATPRWPICQAVSCSPSTTAGETSCRWAPTSACSRSTPRRSPWCSAAWTPVSARPRRARPRSPSPRRWRSWPRRTAGSGG